MEAVCPRCKTTSYRNPSMELMVNVCGHNLCKSCVELLFVKGSGSCPECNIPLRRTNFRLQLFEDANIDKEVDIRRRILRDFNKRQEDFGCLRDYNNYLEFVEDIIYNLSNNIDIVETNKKIHTYKEVNKEQIMKNRVKPSEEALELEDLIAEEKKLRGESIKQEQLIENIEKKNKIRNQEKLIDDLMFGNENADQILQQHREQVQKEEKKKNIFSHAGLDSQNSTQSQAKTIQVPDEPFIYQEPTFDFLGPSPPDSQMLVSDGYTKNIISATNSERAGGYLENIGCLRAVQEAMMGLYFTPIVEHVVD